MRPLALALATLAFTALPAAAQQQIGTTKSVKPAARGSLAGTLSVGAGVHANETIGTDAAGGARISRGDNPTFAAVVRAIEIDQAGRSYGSEAGGSLPRHGSTPWSGAATLDSTWG